MNLLIVGAPGVGKGTMSRYLIKEYGVEHISTGDMLREAIANETEVGLKAKSFMDKGALVPDEIINEIIVERLGKGNNEKGFLFDGYPRTLAQAESLSEILKKLNLKIDAVINLNIDDEIVKKRITGRRTCPQCGEIYNIYFKPSKEEDTCDKCGTKLSTRKDDNIESLKTRLEEFHKNTQPIIEYYNKDNLVKNINADQERDAEFADIKKSLEGIE